MKVKTTTIRSQNEADASLFIDTFDEGFQGSDGESHVEVDERAHSNLLNDINKISKKKRMGAAPKSVRTSTKEGGTKINTLDILKRIGVPSLEKTASTLEALDTPPDKILVKRTKRAVGYQKVAIESDKWSGLVVQRRIERQQTYPLQKPDVRITTALNDEEIKPRTPLEKEIYDLLHGAKLVEKRKETKEEKARREAMSLQELQERNRLAWLEKKERNRIQRKAWMQNKNKSRKFHRLLRKDKLKQQKAELAELERTNPEAAYEKLEELEKMRVEERMTLRHRKSKWAQFQGLRASRDEKAMAALRENKDLHQDLVAKRKMEEEADSEENEENIEEKLEALRKEKKAAIEAGLFDPSNPWMANLYQHVPDKVQPTPTGPIDSSFVNFKKFWEEVNRRKLVEKKALEAIANKGEKVQSDDEEEEEERNDKSVDKVEEKKVKNSKKSIVGVRESNENLPSQAVLESGEVGKLKRKKKKGKKGKTDQDTNKADKTASSSVKDKSKVKATEESDKQPDEKKSRKKKLKNQGEQANKNGENVKNELVTGDLEEQLVSIDNMFNQAERGLQQKLHAKLKRIGVKDNAKWTKVKSKKKKNKKEIKEDNILPKIEEYDFTAKDVAGNNEDGLKRAKNLSDMDVLQGVVETEGNLRKAIKTLETVESGKKKDTSSTVESGKKKDTSSKSKVPAKPAQIDPSNFMQVDTKTLQMSMPDTITRGAEGLDDDDDDDDDDAEAVIRQAFADDYLVEEFKSEKKKAIEESQPKSLELAMPGWGDWTGLHIKMSNRKRKNLTFRAPPPKKRKDDTMDNVIYNEKSDVHKNLRSTMVSVLPYPFARVQDFEASVRAPVGRLFVSEKEHKKLTAPPLITKAGAIIEPMTEEELLIKKPSDFPEKRPTHSKNKKQQAKFRNKNRQRNGCQIVN